MPNFFGLNISRKKNEVGSGGKKAVSFVPPDFDDGSVPIVAGGHYGSYIDFDGSIKTETDLILKYRDMALHAEVESAIEDITNDAIVYDNTKRPVSLQLDLINQPDTIKNKITDEFDNILKLLRFSDFGQEIFRKWYIDGRLYYHIIADEGSKKKGIIELRPIDAVKIRKIREIQKKQQGPEGLDVVEKVDEYFMFSDTDKYGTSVKGIRINKDAICYSHSGLYNASQKRILSYLHKAVKPLNQLRMIEDAVVIYRISRAPERRIFYIDVGNLPKNKAEQYLRDIMKRYKNKLVYDASTGAIRDEHHHMSMLEDYWLPRREGGRGTEISTLDGGQNLGEMEDVVYFQKKLYKSLHVPTSRLDAENGFNMGRSAEITRDELKFFKFIDRLRSRFSQLFLSLLKTQLILKGIMNEDDWNSIIQDIKFIYQSDSHFTELKETELMKERFELLRDANDYIGQYFSKSYIRKNILKQTPDLMKEIDSEISSEGSNEEGNDDEF